MRRARDPGTAPGEQARTPQAAAAAAPPTAHHAAGPHTGADACGDAADAELAAGGGEPAAARARDGDVPRARVEKARSWWTWLWLFPVAAAAYLAWLVYGSNDHGPEITILFHDASDVDAGKTAIRYRGMPLGRVTELTMADDHEQVRVHVTLHDDAQWIARAETAFWIVRPHVSVSAVRGLDALVGDKYIEARPGGGEVCTLFQGLDEPPVVTTPSDGLDVTLLAGAAGSLRRGSPVLYRGLQVGDVTSMRLGDKAQTVRVEVRIRQRFAALVRRESKFWNVGDLRVDLSLFGGLDVQAESLGTLLTGGIAFATPDPPGDAALPEMAFRLYDAAQPEWLKWAPEIPLVNEPEAVHKAPPTVLDDQGARPHGSR